jgi:hypothetical protein
LKLDNHRGVVYDTPKTLPDSAVAGRNAEGVADACNTEPTTGDTDTTERRWSRKNRSILAEGE